MQTIVAGRFELEVSAGSGGMGQVFRARDLQTGGLIALKLLHAADVHGRFEREAEVLARLDHARIVRYVAHGASERGPWLAMEWLTGESLAARLERGALAVGDVIAVAEGAAEALAAVHRHGLVHRDLKPSNLFLPRGRVAELKLLDFGIARVLDGRHTRSGDQMGTLAYMAPEQTHGAASVDARADVFALGCVLFECLAGQPAFAAADRLAVLAKTLIEDLPDVRELRAEVPAGLADLIARMTAKDPDRRPRNGAALHDELAALAGGGAPVGATDARAPRGLTGNERRLGAVVIARLPGDEAAVDAGATAPSARGDQPLRARVRALVEWLGGQLDEPGGALVVTFPGMALVSDQVTQAARCALALAALDPGVEAALASGRGVLAGRLAIGDAIDRAARLLGVGDGVRLDEASAALLDARFDVAGGERGGLVLRGERDPAVPPVRLLLGKPSPFVGRERELEVLRDLYEETAGEPSAHIAVVSGPAGSGKSRLAAELRRRLGEAGREVELVIARGEPLRAHAAFAMLKPAVRRLTEVAEGEPHHSAAPRLRARVGRHLAAAEVGRVADFIGELAGVRPPPGEASVQLAAAWRDPVLMGDQLRRAFTDWLDAESRARPLLLVLEDLQWADSSSLALLDAALRALADRPILVLALGRPERGPLLPDGWGGLALHRLALGPLSRRASEELVRHVLADQLPVARVEAVVARAAGHALFLEELIRAAARGDQRVPESVLGMVSARLESLEPGTRRFLRAASVYGDVFWTGAVAALLGAEAKGARGFLDDLEGHELVQERVRARFHGEREFVFRHALVREAAYALLTEADRALGHRLAAEWLAGAGESDAAVLAEHFERGQDLARAAPAHLGAAQAALGGNDFDGALAHVTRARAADTDAQLVGPLGLIEAEVHNWRGAFPAAEAAAAAAVAVLPRGGPMWCRAQLELAMARGRQGATQGLLAVVRELRGLLSGVADAQLVMVGSRVAVQALFAGLPEEADELTTWAVGAASQLPATDPALSMSVENALAVQAQYAGDPYSAHLLFRTSQENAERAGHLRYACMQRTNAAFCCLEAGQYALAEGLLRPALAAAESMKLTWVVAYTRQNLGLALAGRGALDEARALQLESLRAAEQVGDTRSCGITHAYLASIHLEAGELEAAVTASRTAVDLLAVAPPLRARALATHTLALLHLARTEQALAAAREAMDILASLARVEEGESLVRLACVEALRAAGHHDEARAALARARDRLQERAARIASHAWRECFLHRVPENARTMALAGGTVA